MRFQDKVVLITGASSGIGAETAIHFAREGASLCITGRNETRLEETASKCRELANNVKILQVKSDLSTTEGCEHIFSTFAKSFDKLDILVNNAGVAFLGGIKSTNMDDYDFLFNVNVKAVIHLSKLAIPYLEKTKGCIVNVSSCISLVASSKFSLYGISKAALDYLTRSAALDLSSSGVRVNSVNPGLVRTPIQTWFGDDEKTKDEFYKQAARNCPLGHNVPIAEVAESILYLSSDAASSITGTCLLIDAGLSMKMP